MRLATCGFAAWLLASVPLAARGEDPPHHYRDQDPSPPGIRRIEIDASGKVHALANSGGSWWRYRYAPDGQVEVERRLPCCPADLAVDATGQVYVLDTHDNAVRAYGASGGWDTHLLYPTGPGRLLSPAAIDVSTSDEVLVADCAPYLSARIVRFDRNGAFLGEWPVLPGEAVNSMDLAVAPDGTILLVVNRSRILRYAADGTFETEWAVGFAGSWPPIRLECSPDGWLYVLGATEWAYRTDLHGQSAELWFLNGATSELVPELSDLAFDRDGFVHAPGRLRWLERGEWNEAFGVFRFWYSGTRIRADAPGTRLRVDGETYGHEQVFRWTPGTVHDLDLELVEPGEPDVRREFVRWSDGGAMAHSIVIPDGRSSVVAEIRVSYPFRMSVEGVGNAQPPSGWYLADTTLVLEAHAGSGHTLAEWRGSGPGSYSGELPAPAVRLRGPVSQTAVFSRTGVTLSISASATDPFVNVAPAESTDTLFLWATCVDLGLSALEADVIGIPPPAAFVPMNDVLNVYGNDPSRLLLAVPDCPRGAEVNRLLGRWVLGGPPGEVCLGPSVSGSIVTVDCRLDPRNWPDPRVIGFSSTGSPPCAVGTNACTDGRGAVRTEAATFTATAALRAVRLAWAGLDPLEVRVLRLERADDASGPWVVVGPGDLAIPDGEWTDPAVAPRRTYVYRLVMTGPQGSEMRSDPAFVETSSWSSGSARLDPADPNPVRGETRLSFAVDTPGVARVAIYNVAGRRVRVLVEREVPAGESSVIWDGRDAAGRFVAPGIYFARLETPQVTRSRKLVVAPR